MDTLTSMPPAFDLREPIPGYELRERIGAGGYGEVWRAEAPGGLAKAVKIVFGPLRAGRAERELKALGRIKQVQHPLLLSLERIEMVNEHLIIVMELAHGNLKERFEQCVDEGHRGIPRGELLAYLRDVADALDYLYEEHSLQHLDVKPENLLLIANRVKVADFGLVKDLGECSESLVGGLTPLYAPPEVFDGRPNRNSDQYSLAMVFQELLTGEPPFSGRTVAQLAAQHLHSSPCLVPLPKTDQPIIGRALSKDPDRRFPSCRALIDSLADAPKADNRTRRSVGDSTRITPASQAAYPSSQADRDGGSPVTYPVANTVRYLPPLDAAGADEAACRPAVFIGIGGTGALVLRSLRARLNDRFGKVDEVPALQMLLMDTDIASLHNATRGDHGEALRSSQLVPLALRSPQEYRGDAASLLEWLNRRWLFNIPRSLTTEGIRPLGRLALVDHFDAVANALHCALTSVTADESLAASSSTTGLRFVKLPPRVFVVASMAGGTGSGLALDLGYLIRTMLEELHIPDDQLCGVLAHSTSRRTSQRDLAVANSLSLLAELHHYTSDAGYPGEPACKLPPRVGNSGPFRHTYVTHLGDELNEQQFLDGAAALSEYLYQNSVSKASAVFDRCRGTSGEPSGTRQSNPAAFDTVRSFGVVQVGGTNDEIVRQQANSLCRTLVSRWAAMQQGSAVDAASKDMAAEQLCELSRRLLHLRNEFSTPEAGALDNDRNLARVLSDQHIELTKQLDRELVLVLSRKQMSLSDLLTAGSDVWANLVSSMRATAQRVAGNAISRLEVSHVIQGNGTGVATGPATAADAVRAARPLLTECGGECRYLLVTPQSTATWPAAWKQPFDEAAGASSSLAAGTDDRLAICCELQSVPLQNVVAQLAGSRSDLLKTANRLHTRIDVDWPSLERWLAQG